MAINEGDGHFTGLIASANELSFQCLADRHIPGYIVARHSVARIPRYIVTEDICVWVPATECRGTLD